MNKIKIVFMGTPEFSVNPLKELYKESKIEIGFVITGEDKKRSRNKTLPTPVKKEAINLGLETYEPKNVNSPESIKKIHDYNPDYIIVIAYGQMIKDELLNAYKDKIINIHSSLLPKYRGAAPMQWTILNKEKEAGVCSMLIEKSMDTGDILDCRKININSDTSIENLHDELSVISGELIVNTILNYENLYKNRKKQDESLASYSKKITKEMGHIDFNKESADIKAQIMAFSTWPSAYVILNDEKVKIHNIDIMKKYNNIENGVIIKADDEGIFVNCEDACIIIKKLQFPGKTSMDVKSYLLGNEIEVGLKLN